MTQPLTGRTIALAEGRQLEELAQMLEKEGAQTVRCPMFAMLDQPDEAPVQAWLDQLVAARFDLVVCLTGEGVRRLLGFAERAGKREAFIAALGKTRAVTRGPKPVRALKELGLAPARVAETPTTDGVIATLRTEELAGKTVGVQLYSDAPSPLLPFLAEQGATSAAVLPYVYAPAADAVRVVDLIQQMAQGKVDAVCFTSSPQVDRLFEVAADKGLTDALRQGLQRVRVAAVGPVVAASLHDHGRDPDVCPEQGFVMKNLVQMIKRDLTGTAS